MLKSITKTIDDLKGSIVSQLEEFKLSYQKVKLIGFRRKNSCSKKLKNASPPAIWPITRPLMMFSPLKITLILLDFENYFKN